MGAVEHRLTCGLRRSVPVDVGIQRGGGQAVAARPPRPQQLCGPPLPTSPSSAWRDPFCAPARQPGHGAFGDQLTLERGELGESDENAEGEPPVGCRRVDLRTSPGQHLQANAPGAQILDRVDQVTQVAAEPIELLEHQGVAGLNRLLARDEAPPVITAARRKVFINAREIDAGRQHGVSLRDQSLGPVRFGHPRIADQHRGTRGH